MNTTELNHEASRVRDKRVNVDPILQELWDIKAQINREGNYDVRTIALRANESAKPYLKNGRVCADLFNTL